MAHISSQQLLAVVATGLVRYVRPSSLAGHQLFKRYETFSIPAHLTFLFAPPLFAAVLLTSRAPQLSDILALIAVYISTVAIATLAYRLSPFHPLAKYPGPAWCKISKFWMACISYTGQQHTYLKYLHDRYGDIIRTGPNDVSIRDPAALHAIFGSTGLPHGPMFVGRLLTVKDMPLVGIMDTEEHLRRRKPWACAFNGTALKEYEPLVAKRAHQLVQALERQKGEVDIGNWANYFSYDFMCDMAYGGGSELLGDGNTNGFWRLLEAGLPIGTFLSHVPWLALYLARIPGATLSVQRVLAHSEDLTKKRLQNGSRHKDLFHYLNHEDQPDIPPPPMKQVVSEGIIAVVAGSDTVSSALTSIFFCVTANPQVYKRLQDEIDRFYPPAQDSCDTQYHREMHYLTAVINESLRIYPPVPGGSQRQVPRDSNGAMLGSYFLPAGTAALLHTYSLQRDPRSFSPHPESFWPERWLLASGRISFAEAGIADKALFAHNENAFLPFSYGPMNCVGKNLALLEIRAVVISVLQKFRLELRAGWNTERYEEGFKDQFVTTRPAVPVTLTPRF
ncbi:high nitrogen upregulated cytochrome P450 monooxygenase 2 [Cubamyces sp. BRFM 1775]|nr:high nitrogen upregulated cytochrome P450 monooxygenase 2 [Cubamyces sp. BRFM 1775]